MQKQIKSEYIPWVHTGWKKKNDLKFYWVSADRVAKPLHGYL